MMHDDFDFKLSERMDADAVCARCGSVSPEGTLLCKTCGNNLRDQRAQRTSGVVADVMPEATATQVPWVKAGLTILGILLIVWTALNVGQLEETLVQTQSMEQSSAKLLWQGADNSVFSRMAQELIAQPITPEERDVAIAKPLDSAVYDGRYAIVMSNRVGRQVTIGDAIVKQDGERLLYVAFLHGPSIEIRGVARFEENSRIASRGTAGLKDDTGYYDASGFAQASETGGFECYGLTTLDSTSYSALAFRIPSSLE